MEYSDAVRLVRIHPGDNVGVLASSVLPGQVVAFEGMSRCMEEGYSLGHKFALSDIPKGGKVLKYGIPIGSATKDIQAGEHVHLHNLKSDYLPTYTLDGERNFSG